MLAELGGKTNECAHRAFTEHSVTPCFLRRELRVGLKAYVKFSGANIFTFCFYRLLNAKPNDRVSLTIETPL